MDDLIDKPSNNKAVGVVSLGCDKNRIDTEHMLYALKERGYTFTSEFDKASIIVVNTCAFIESARKETIDNILQMAQYKHADKGVCQKLVVTGCFPQKYIKDGIAAMLPEVDAFLGVGVYGNICDIIDSLYNGQRCIETGIRDDYDSINRIITTPMHYAYLKIAEGCDSACTFCTIPSIRGKYRSRSLPKLVDEVKTLVDKGSKEVILVAQDVTNYGADIGSSLISLLEQIGNVEGVKWIRLMYCYPELVSDELIRLISEHDKIAKYIDIPMQHVSDKILRLMARRNDKKSTLELVDRIRAIDSDIAIRSTFMTGFPCETDVEHRELCDFLTQYRLDNVGFFKYSKEEGTPSFLLPNHVPQKIKNARFKELNILQQDISREMLTSKIGKTVTVLYEDIDYDRQMFVGRTMHSAPDIDGRVYFAGDDVDVGCFYNVVITDAQGYDLIGRLV